MKKALIILISIFSLTGLNAQNVEFIKQNFPDQKKEMKEAINNIEMGDYYVNQEYPKYKLARRAYQRAQDFNPSNALLNYKLGITVIKDFDKVNALGYFKKAHDLNPDVHELIRFQLGRAYQLNYDFKEALYNFKEYRNSISASTNPEMYERVSKHITECQTGEKLVANPIRVWVDNLGKEINSPLADYGAFISTDEELIVFTSRRAGSTGSKKDPEDDAYFEDIYISRKNPDGTWGQAENLGDNINTESHDAISGVSPDGTAMFVYYGHKGYGDIFTSEYTDGDWGKTKTIGKKINGKTTWETAATVSADGERLYFVSNRPGGKGGRDIWYSDWDYSKETWGEPVNAGGVINTKHDEVGVFFHPDGKTLYFASTGHETMGGFDVFESVYENGNWSTPKNIGYPINTPDDDVFFVTNASGKRGYYASFKPDGVGEKDIYVITFLGPEKQPLLSSEDNLIASIAKPVTEKIVEPKIEVQTKNLSILKGIVRDEESQETLASTVELVNNTTGQILGTFKTNAADGKFMVTLPSGGNYGIAVKAEKYLFHSENFDIPSEAGYRLYRKDVDLKKVKVGKTIVLRNIFYDLDKATLRPESKAELERLNKLMIENPTLKIELSGHTDSRGSSAYNQKLSENRAKAVVDYLINLGISKDRMVYVGYGEQKLIKTDAEIKAMQLESEREEAHQENRRTEFKILSI